MALRCVGVVTVGVAVGVGVGVGVGPRRRCCETGQLRYTCIEQERFGSGDGIDRIELVRLASCHRGCHQERRRYQRSRIPSVQ